VINGNRMLLTYVLKEISIIDYVTYEMWKGDPSICMILRAKYLNMKTKDLSSIKCHKGDEGYLI